MKQVLLQTPPPLTPDNVSNQKYYGFNMRGNSKGFISASGEYVGTGSYNARFFLEMTRSNKWFDKDIDNLKECVSRLLCERETVVYEFNTWKELCEWAIDPSK